MGNLFDDHAAEEPEPEEKTYEEILLERLKAEKGFTTTSKALIAQIEADLEAYREHNQPEKHPFDGITCITCGGQCLE